MSAAEKLQNNGYQVMLDKSQAIIEHIKCPVCNNYALHLEKAQSNGNMMYKEACVVCDWESRFLRHKKNKNKRPSSTSNWAEWVKQNADYACEICGSTKDIEAHHILMFKYFPEEVDNIRNGICVCKNCHTKIHSQDCRIGDKL